MTRTTRTAVRVAALACSLLALLCGAAGASAATSPSRLSVVYDPANGDQGVYWEAPNGALMEDVWSGHWSGPVAITGAGRMASAPAVVYVPGSGDQGVYWEAPNGSVQEDVWVPSRGWSGPASVTGPGTLTLPSAPASPKPGTQPTPTSAPTLGSSTLTPPAPPPPSHRAHRRRVVRVKIKLRWRWNGRRTRLVGITFGRLPPHAVLRISCRGRGCPRRAMTARAHRFGSLAGRPRPVYRAGDRLLISVSAPHYRAERAEVRIRRGRIPAARLLK